MRTWIISIGSVVILTTLVSLILPEGKLGKSIKSIFSLITVLVILQPLMNLKNVDYNEVFYTIDKEIEIQQGFIYYITEQKITNYQKQCQDYLTKIGVENASVRINYIVEKNGQAIIYNVIVNLENSVINSDKTNIDIKEQIKIDVAKLLNVDKTKVIIND